MATITAASSKPHARPKEGQHEVMLVQVIDLGTQPSKNPEFEPSRQLELMFEVMDETHEFTNKDGSTEVKPFAIWKWFITPYVSKKKVTKYHALLNALAGKTITYQEALALDFNTFIGSIYSATVVYTWDFANVDNFTKASAKLVEAYKEYEAYNPRFVFSLEDFNQKIYDSLPERKQTKIMQSPEYQEITKEGVFWDTAVDWSLLPF